jgi:hypothetical protein
VREEQAEREYYVKIRQHAQVLTRLQSDLKPMTTGSVR